jgi:hypothetical protein
MQVYIYINVPIIGPNEFFQLHILLNIPEAIRQMILLTKLRVQSSPDRNIVRDAEEMGYP